MAAGGGPRVLVHLRQTLCNPDQTVTTLAKFTQCIVDHLNGDDEKSDVVNVKCMLENNKLILERATDTTIGHPLRHPPFCPIRMLGPADIKQLPDDITARGVNVGVVAVMESSDGRVLITRRASHMRTFPGVWVPPGGGIDHGETLHQTCLRELAEETGLKILDKELVSSDVLCLWESVYPPYLDWAPPKRHHIVVYFHLLVNQPYVDLCKRTVLDPEEVDAACWLSQRHVAYVMEGRRLAGLEETFTVLQLSDDGEQSEVTCPVDFLSAKAPKDGADVERVSSGTRYALSEWLRKKGGVQECDAKL